MNKYQIKALAQILDYAVSSCVNLAKYLIFVTFNFLYTYYTLSVLISLTE